MVRNEADIIWGDLIYAKRNKSDKIVRYWKSSPYQKGKFKKGFQIPHTSSLVRKELFDIYGYFREDFKISGDYELFLRFLEKNKIKSYYIPEVLAVVRTGGKSKKIIKGNMECVRAWKINNLKIGLQTIPLKVLRKLLQKNIFNRFV